MPRLSCSRRALRWARMAGVPRMLRRARGARRKRRRGAGCSPGRVVTIGAEPRRLDIPGTGLVGVGHLRGLAKAEQLRDDLSCLGRDDGHLVIAGAGRIGLEAAAWGYGVDVNTAEPEPPHFIPCSSRNSASSWIMRAELVASCPKSRGGPGLSPATRCCKRLARTRVSLEQHFSVVQGRFFRRGGIQGHGHLVGAGASSPSGTQASSKSGPPELSSTCSWRIDKLNRLPWSTGMILKSSGRSARPSAVRWVCR